MSKKTPHNPRGYSAGHKARLFVTYWGLIAMLAALFFFSIGPLLSGQTIVILTLASFVVAGIATFAHVRKGTKDRLDEIADKMK